MVIWPQTLYACVTPEIYKYKLIDDINLKLYIYRPKNDASGSYEHPAIVFFHGGAWRGGSHKQFSGQATWLCQNAGLVAISVEYRANSNPQSSVDDAIDAFSWVRQHQMKFRIRPDRIAISGGSAGGQLAIITTILSESKFMQTPNSLILFNPVVNLKGKWERTFGRRLSQISPLQLMDAPLPPTLIMHGTKDDIVKIKEVRTFVAKAKKVQTSNITLIEYQGRKHAFFNKDWRGDKSSTTLNVYNFLSDLGWF